MREPTIFELSRRGRKGVTLPRCGVPTTAVPQDWVRKDLALPEVSEVDVVRHFVRLSQLNYSVDTGFYPLGSCTMKYNPKANEAAARLKGFTDTHPLQDASTVQGSMELMFELQRLMGEICGFPSVSLQPSAGAQGELTGILTIRAYLKDIGQGQRTRIFVPDSAHGTNPASTAMAGLEVQEIPSDARGNVDLAKLEASLDDRVAGLMITNPNTLGLFDEHLLAVTRSVHEAGGLVYGDGANLNALLGICKPGEMGIDVMHVNLHKTFSTPHGGGGPGACAVVASQKLAPYLPGPIVEKTGAAYVWMRPPRSIGRVRTFHGNFGILVRAYTYIRMLGAAGLKEVAENAVLNANYLQARIKKDYPIPFDQRTCMHEFVAQGKLPGAPSIHALDIAKRLIDYGFHPPTNYFPLIVPEALMIEPTETESKETLDRFAEAMAAIAREARENPQLLHDAPHDAPAKRMDEVRAARELRIVHEDDAGDGQAHASHERT